MWESNSKSLSLGLTKNSNAKFGIVITFALNSEQKFHHMKPTDVPRKKVDHAGMYTVAPILTVITKLFAIKSHCGMY